VSTRANIRSLTKSRYKNRPIIIIIIIYYVPRGPTKSLKLLLYLIMNLNTIFPLPLVGQANKGTEKKDGAKNSKTPAVDTFGRIPNNKKNFIYRVVEYPHYFLRLFLHGSIFLLIISRGGGR